MKKNVKLSKVINKFGKELEEDLREEGVNLEEADLVRKVSCPEVIDAEHKALFEEGERAAIKYVSTRDVDQGGDIVVPKGVMLKQFEKTGSPVFWGHNYSIPQIGKDAWIKRDQYGIKVKQIYADTGEGTLAEILWRLTKQGMNKQSSVGIIPLEYVRKGEPMFEKALKELKSEWPELKATAKAVRRIITKSILFEHSDVGLGMNSDTDVLAVAKQFRQEGASEVLLKQLGLNMEEKDEGSKDTVGEEVTKSMDDVSNKDVADTQLDTETNINVDVNEKALVIGDNGNGVGEIKLNEEYVGEKIEAMLKEGMLKFSGDKGEIKENVENVPTYECTCRECGHIDERKSDSKEYECLKCGSPKLKLKRKGEEVPEKPKERKVSLVKEARTVKCVALPQVNLEEVKERAAAEVRKRLGRIV